VVLAPTGNHSRGELLDRHSGLSRDSGMEAIKGFMQVKSVWIAQQTSVANPFIMR